MDTIYLILVEDKPNSKESSASPQVYKVMRKALGSTWNTYDICGLRQVPNLLVAIRVHRLPKDAQRLTEEESDQYYA